MAPPYTNFLGGPVFWGQVSSTATINRANMTNNPSRHINMRPSHAGSEE